MQHMWSRFPCSRWSSCHTLSRPLSSQLTPASFPVVRNGPRRLYAMQQKHPSSTVKVHALWAYLTTTFRLLRTRALLQIRLSVTLEDLTVYVAQRADKERESVIRQLSAPVDAVKGKLVEMEETLEGFQRTMHLVLSEVDADRERSAAIAVRCMLCWMNDLSVAIGGESLVGR